MINGDYILVKAPSWYRGKRYRGSYCYEHHLVWEEGYGYPVPDGCVVRHKDGNKRNNSLWNLELCDYKTYDAHKHGGVKMMMLRCPSCGRVFAKDKRLCCKSRGKVFFCSRDCVHKFCFANRSKMEKNIARRINVIEEFRIVG